MYYIKWFFSTHFCFFCAGGHCGGGGDGGGGGGREEGMGGRVDQGDAWELIMWSQQLHHTHPTNSPIILFRLIFVWPPKKPLSKSLNWGEKPKTVSMHGNIGRTRFNQRSPRPLEEVVLNYHRHTDRHTHTQTGMATLWLNRLSGADSVKI